MSILVDRNIEAAQHNENGGLHIEPFNPANLQGNAYDVHLGSTLMVIENQVDYIEDQDGIAVYPTSRNYKPAIDCKSPIKTISYEIESYGHTLNPGVLYLGVTTERVTLKDFCAMLNGKSSLGRSGLSPHYTAGLIDAGFDGYITLEITVVHPIRVYVGMPIAQLVFHTLTDAPIKPYNLQKDAKYNGQLECVPVAPKFYQNFNQETGQWK